MIFARQGGGRRLAGASRGRQRSVWEKGQADILFLSGTAHWGLLENIGNVGFSFQNG